LAAAAASRGAIHSAWFAHPWQSEQGLPNNTIYGLAQTPDGFLWLGTPSGLVRFDGLRFEDFAPTNFVALPNRGTIVMLKSRGGALWLGLDRGGVVCLDGATVRDFTASLPNSIPYAMAEDAEGGVWVSYHDGAVFHIKETKVLPCTGAEGLPEGRDLCALTSDTKGRIWFIKSGHFGVLRGGAFQTLHTFPSSPSWLAPARAGGVWVCTGFRLYRVEENGEPQDLGQFKTDRAGTIANVLLEDHEGAVWIGTSFSGLFRYDQGHFEAIQTTHQEILSLAEDKEGNLWVGTAGGGLNRVRRRAIELEGPDTGLPFAAVQSICEDSSGAIWAATQNGVLVRRTNDQWTPIPAGESWPGDATCVAADPHGSVWVGTHFNGVYCWRDNGFTDWGGSALLRTQTVHMLHFSRAGDLWVGEESPARIARLRNGQVTTFDLPPDSRIPRAMAEDADGNIWVGTSKGVLVRLSGDQMTEAAPRPAHELASIRCLYATPDGALWIGYAGWGVGRLKHGQYAEARMANGLYDDYISHIVADDRGWLWFGANRGIFKTRYRDLEDLLEGRSTHVRSIHYGTGEGLPSLQGKFGDSPDSLRSSDGRLWLPMHTALAVVDPEKLGENPEPPTTLLSSVSVDDRTLGWYGGVLPVAGPVMNLRTSETALRLPPGHRRIQFEFAAPSFTTPENLQFRYRLENYDEDWQEAGPGRGAEYKRLPAGSYRFQAVACNQAGVWSSAGASFSFIVSPFIYQTWWFRLAALAAFTGCVIGIVRYVSFRRLHYRLSQLEAQAALHRERARIAKDIHDDLGANLTQIALMGDLARQDAGEPEKAAERVGRISATARQAIKSLDEIVWAVNPRNDTLPHLLDYAGQFAIDYLRLAGLRCRLDFPEQTPPRELSTDLRHNLFLVIKEALHNVVKHARASEVWFRARVTPDALEMSVEDDGSGFATAPDNALSDGLRNMQQRLADIGGECRIQSHPGAGTKVLIHLPWPQG
jgi:signal transduction histidine kinase/ligand-binding sensor domain-containing protein